MDPVFPFAQYWGFFAWFTIFVLILLAVDLGVFHRTAHEVSLRESLTRSVVWVGVLLLLTGVKMLWAPHPWSSSDSRWCG